MSDIFSDKDKYFMNLAIKEAEISYNKGNFPCGAVLVVDDEIVDKGQNEKEVRRDRMSHAEMLLYIRSSALLKKSKKEGKNITMYTTLEPCLMCFGAATMHRVDRIVAASPDPFGDMSGIDAQRLGEFYTNNLPKLEYGLYFRESFALIKSYLEKQADKESGHYLELFSELETRF